MKVERTDINGKQISRDDVHNFINKSTVCNEIINNTIFAIKEVIYERK